jgi:octaprenyl-diphosphate synthase
VSQTIKPAAPDNGAARAMLYGPVADQMVEVEDLLREQMRSQFPEVDEMVRYGCLLGGKRLRPALLLLAGQAVGELSRDHIVLGAVVEMIHTATLIHDDVLDGAEMRRHLATVNSRWDNAASVLLGDFLFTHAFYLASTTDSTFACRTIGQTTNIVCEGELRQKCNRGDLSLAEDDYLQIINAKTAALVECSCQLGAHCAGGDLQTVARLARYGADLGAAFQIADDLLDVVGDPSTVGKTLGTDLEQRIATLPLIHAMTSASDSERERLEGALAAGGAIAEEALESSLARHQSIDFARAKANGFASRAREQLNGLPDSPALQVLIGLTEFVVQRSH